MHRDVMAIASSTFFINLRKGPEPRARLNLPDKPYRTPLSRACELALNFSYTMSETM
jgi:hypothetical protein